MKSKMFIIFMSLFAFNAFADAHDYNKNKSGTSKQELEYKSEQYLKGKKQEHANSPKNYKDKANKDHKDFYDKKRKYGP